MLSDFNYEKPDRTNPEEYGRKFYTKELYSECDFWTLEGEHQGGRGTVSFVM